MNSTPGQELLFIATRSPWSGSAASAGADLLMTAAVFEQAVCVVFCGEGVWQLHGNQDGAQLKMKTLARIFPAFELYDIKHVLVSESALRDRSLAAADLLIDVSVVSDEEIRALIASSRATFVF